MAFATADDVSVRLGRDLTNAETEFANAAIAQITGLIADAVGKDAAWAAALDPVPMTLTSICIEKVVRIGANPTGVVSETESLGAHSYSARFPDAEGLLLTPTERSLARQAVLGGYLLSPRTPPIEDTFYPPEIDPFFIGS